MTTSNIRQHIQQAPQTLSRYLERLFNLDDLFALLMTFVLLVMPALALDAADWPLSLSIVLPTITLSVLFGYVLAQSRYDEFFALLVSTIYGVVFVLLIAAFNQPEGVLASIEIVLTRSFQWVRDAVSGGINQDSLVFSMVVALLFWFFGYNAVWHIFRLDRVWRVVIPPAMILLVNMIVYTGTASLDIYLILFVLMTLLLIVRSNLEAREWDWYVNSVRVPQRLRMQFLSTGAALSLMALLLAWSLPSGNLQQRLDDFQRFLSNDAIRQMSEFWNRLVEPIETEGPATADYYGGDTLNLGGAISLGDQVVMLVDVADEDMPPLRYYWRARVFEVYQGGRWTPSATRRVPDLNPPLEILTNTGVLGGSRVRVDHRVTVSVPSRLYHTLPQPIQISEPGRIDLYRTGNDQDNAAAPMNVSVIRPVNVLETGESYQAVGAMSVASAFDLRSAGTDYPDWVRNPSAYNQGISPRVAGLARQIVDEAGATTPYDQAKAIESWLRRNIAYDEQIPRPPQGVDTVEWFLFQQQSGYCTYYATSMIQMLRSLEVPARMAAGFSQGESSTETGQYVVRERDAHTWVEVYFPGYGWVEFEPTAAEDPLTREGDLDQVPRQAGSQAEPTTTPTPLPSPTPPASPSPEPDQPQPELQATMTATPNPTMTATPVIVPTERPPVQPPDPPSPGFLNFLLPALGIAGLIFGSMLLLVLLALLIYWWWEWRGLRDLSPVGRAYARLERYTGLLGLHSANDQTPDERRAQIVRALPAIERPVTYITRAYIIERYANRPVQESDPEHPADYAWQQARSEILRRWLRDKLSWLWFIRD